MLVTRVVSQERTLLRSLEGRRGTRQGTWPVKKSNIGEFDKCKAHLMGSVTGKAGEGAVEVAVGGGSLRKLFDHVKVVLANVAPFARHNVTILQKATIN